MNSSPTPAVRQLDSSPVLSEVHSLAPRPESAAEARRIVSEACQRWGLSEVCDSASLVITELVANGVRHAATPLTLRLVMLSGGMRLEVADDSIRAIRVREASPMDEGGRGLFLVDALAARWGVDAHPAGKRVWAELS